MKMMFTSNNARPAYSGRLTKHLWVCCLTLLGAFFMSAAVHAQGCENSSRYPSGTITPNSNGSATTISTCQYFSEYSEITGISAGSEYAFTAEKNSVAGFITVRSGSVDGPVIGNGYSPLNIVAPGSDNLFVHWNVDENCTTGSGCSTTTVACITCATLPDCEGVPGGPAQPGNPCDDGDASTVGETYQSDCSCGGGVPVAANDEPCDATVLICGDTIVQSLEGATASLNDNCGGTGSADVWFNFTTNGSEIVTVGEGGGVYFDAVVQLFQGDDCGNLTEVGACDDFPENFTVTEAGNYYFRVRPWYSSEDDGIISVYLNCVPYDCPEILANFGDACDDGNPETENDVVTEDCGCAGVVPGPGMSCSLAIPLACGADPATYSSVGSTAINNTNCTMGNNGLWFTFVGNGGEIVINSTASFDHEMSINTGTCDALASIGCRDYSTGTESFTINETVAGQIYYVYVAHWSGGNTTTGDITIDINCSEPPACDAPELVLTAVDASGALIEGCVPADGEYYVRAELNGGAGNNSYDVSANGSDFVNVPAEGETVFGPFSVGVQVSVYAVGANDDACESESFIESPEPCPPANDNCGDAIAVELGEAGVIGNNTGATADGPAMDCAFFGDAVQNDIWFSFVAPENGNLTIETFKVDGSGFSDTQIQILDGCDGNVIACDEDGGAILLSKIQLGCGEYTPGQTYLIQLDGYGGDSGQIKISVVSDEASCVTYDCPDLELNFGDPCDDGNPNTENDVVTEDCGCAGTIVFDCPQLEANIGDACDDGNPNTENDVVTEDCGCAGTIVFDCPQLEANIGDACDDGDANTINDVVTEDCGCAGTPVVVPVCEDFVYYLADNENENSVSDIYRIEFNGGVAELQYIITSDVEVHLAYNPVNNLLYAISRDYHNYRTLNPHVANPAFSAPVDLGSNLTQITAAVFNHEGKLLIGSQNQNKIWSVNVNTNVVSPYDNYSPVQGGDLAFASDGMLYLATRTGSGLYANWPSMMMPDQLIGSVPNNVTGLAITDMEQLLVSSLGSTSLELRNTDGSNPNVSFPVMLNGEPYTLRNGDMASGCNTYNDQTSDDCDYKLYYIHSPQGNGMQPLLEVTLNNDGTASYNAIISNIGGHIALSNDGSLIYNVGGSDLKIIDVALGSVISTVNIVSATGNNLSGFPAAVVGSDGTLYVANSGTDRVYTLDPITGIATPYGPARNVNGGDLIELDGEIWLITRNNNKFTNVITGVNFTVPVNQINGAAVLSNGNVLVADGNGNSLLKEIDITTQQVVATYDINLPLHNGDLAGKCTAVAASIEGCFGAEILDFNQGLQTNGGAVATDRSNPATALGEPDRSNAPGGFVSLGVGGHITIGFAGVVNDQPGNDIRIWETSYAGDVCSGSSDEQADIELSADGINFYYAGTICRDGEVDMAVVGLPYVTAVRITNSANTGSLDGYDVDGIEAINGCSNEPVIEEGDCYASEVVEYLPGVNANNGPMEVARTNPANALGQPERANSGYIYTSLGYGGSLTLAFNGAVPNGPGDDLEVVETTYGNQSACGSYPEYADVYVSVDGLSWHFAKTVCKFDGFVDISDAGNFAYINFVKLVNNDELSATPDAYDVDGVVALHNCEGIDEGEGNEPGFAEAESVLSTFPNPTEGMSHVVFTPAETGNTFVDVYDMNGRKIATIFDQVAQKGQEYQLDFNGLSLPNGFYVYVLTNNSQTTIERFLIAK